MPIAVAEPVKLSWAGGDGEWDATCDAIGEVVHVKARGSGTTAVLFMHGSDPDRSASEFEGFWPAIVDAGHAVLAIDMPGYGASGGKREARRDGLDENLLLGVLQSFSVSEVSVFTEGGGASPFLRAIVKAPSAFGAHHALLNPVISAVPEALKSTLESVGSDLMFILADQWCDDDAPNRAAMCKQMFKWFEVAPDRIANLITLVPPGVKSKVLKPMREPDWLAGRVQESAFSLQPHPDMLQELLSYLGGPRVPIVKPQGSQQAPTKSALEMGHDNSSFRVFVRIRPLLPREDSAEASQCVEVVDVKDFPREPPPQRVVVSDRRLGGVDKELFTHHTKRGEFVFDRAFQPASQEELFTVVGEPLVHAVLEGTNATIFAYGQTGTGKTWTMEGPSDQPGLTSRAVRALYAGLKDTQTVHVQYLQLYDEAFLDLLDPPGAGGGSKKLSVAEGANFTYLKGATFVSAPSAEAAVELITRGAAFRAHGKTNMNDASSRSHAILLLAIGEKEAPAESGVVLYMVDLAGSERQKRSGVTGQGLNEMIANNAALSTLGRVVSSLVEKDGQRASHIAYKDNPLTDLLKCGIGGNSRTALVACLTASSDSLDESLNTLRFAVQCSHVKNKVAKKDKKDVEKAKAADIASSGNELDFDADGAAEVPLPAGTISVRGSWDDASLPAVILLSDSEHTMGWGSEDPAQFDGLVALLKGSARVICPKIGWGKDEKQPEKYVPQLLALCDWLGLAKPVVYGRDCGAMVALAFKIAYPGRCGMVLMENMREAYDEVEFKKRMKKDPTIAMGSYGGPFSLITPMNGKNDGAGLMKGIDKLKGKSSLLLWPCQMKGKPAKKCMMSGMGEFAVKAVKGCAMVDTAAWINKGDEPRHAEIMKHLK